MKIRKRDKNLQEFDKNKVKVAITKANNDTDEYHKIWEGDIDPMVNEIVEEIKADHGILDENEDVVVDIESVQDAVELCLQREGYYTLAKNYIKYRFTRELARQFKQRDDEVLELISGTNDELNKENSNKDTRLLSTMRDYEAGIVCRDIAERLLLPKDIVKAHKEGIIHFHDMDYSPTMPMHNCGLINLDDMLQNGTVISGTMIEKPHSFRTACTIVTQIITQVASNQYGGNTISLSALAPFVDISRQKIRKQVEKEFNLFYDQCVDADAYINWVDETINEVTEQRLRDEIKDGVQTIQYQLITMSTTNGQAPFTSVFMYLDEVPDGQTREDLAMIIEEVLRQRIEGVKNEQGVPVTTAFPKLLYCLDEDNIHEDSKYWYLTKLAAECTSKRLVPDYISAKKMRELKGDVYPCMGCRSFLTPHEDHKYYGRFNQGVVTINLPDVALSSGGDFDKFWSILEERLDLCYRALMVRHNRLLGTPSDVSPILWQNGGYARLKSSETIDKLLYGNYSTISLGYAGLYECVKYMTGKSHTEDGGYEFGIQVMQSLSDHCAKWRADTNISFSLYGSPIESTTYKFAKCLQKRFGIIEGITDKKYVTNSYHITPSEPIDAFSKLSIEAKFQELSAGGAISYIETPNLEKNVDAIIEVIKHIYNEIIYAEINTMTSYCHVCGCTDIKMGDDLKFHCPQCGNDDFNKMNIALRICGYISTNPFNEGRANDIHDRVYHLGME